MKIGLVLGGGGARGLAHIGLLKTFEENNIKIDFITGSSMGALIGAMYAQDPNAKQVEERVKTFLTSDKFKKAGKNYFKHQQNYEPGDLIQHLGRQIKQRVIINLAAHRKSLMKGARLKLAVSELLANDNIENTAIPFACSATDLRYGKPQIFKQGNIRSAVMASAAIPGFIPPIEYEDKVLVDGSVCNNFPVDAVKELGAEFIIASDVSLLMDSNTPLTNVIDIIIRANTVSTNRVNELLLEKVDFIIAPEMGNVHWSQFEKYDYVIKKGYEASGDQVQKLLNLIAAKKSFLKRSLARLSRIIGQN